MTETSTTERPPPTVPGFCHRCTSPTLLRLGGPLDGLAALCRVCRTSELHDRTVSTLRGRRG